MSEGLPTGPELGTILGLRLGGGVEDLLAQSLLSPLAEFLSRPSKRFRGQLLRLGYQLARAGQAAPEGRDRYFCDEGAALIEEVHAGSLVVDDIQDGSAMRRGQPALHRRHGVPLALNAGNWLYFWPLERVRTWSLDAARELGVYRVCHRALLRAHCGQALDVGVPIDELPQERVPAVSLASLELKTGALMAMAMSLGAVLGGADGARLDTLDDFGHRFGVGLQMFDDVGNLGAGQDEKRYEDLRLRRPSWLWAVVAGDYDAAAYGAFVESVRALPDAAPLERWLAGHDALARARRRAGEHLAGSVRGLETALRGTGGEALAAVKAIGERLTQAYE